MSKETGLIAPGRQAMPVGGKFVAGLRICSGSPGKIRVWIASGDVVPGKGRGEIEGGKTGSTVWRDDFVLFGFLRRTAGL